MGHVFTTRRRTDRTNGRGIGRQCAVERGSIEAGGSSRAARAARACRSRSENRRSRGRHACARARPRPSVVCTCTRDTRLYAPRASTYVCVYVPACVRACVYRASEGERREAAEEFTAACELRESVALDSRIAISVKVSTSCFHVYNDPVISYSIVVIYTCCIPGEETEFRACEA